MKQTITHRPSGVLDAFRIALLGLVAALGVASFAIGPALALQVDQTRNFPARQLTEQAVNYYRLTVNYNDQNITAGQQFGALPAGAYILSIDAYVSAAFNAGTTNNITIGTTKANANEILATGINGATSIATGIYHLTSAAGLGTAVTSVTTPVPLFVKYVPTGTAATAGSVTIVIAYVPNNDM